MECERVRWLLSLDPTGQALAHDSSALRHLDSCPTCAAFARALATVDEALTAWPLARPRAGLAAAVLQAARRWPRADAIEQPFSRPFWLFSAAVVLLALASGALLLQSSPARGDLLTHLWLNPSWANDASAWLSLQADSAAQVILALMAGLVITVAGATAGLRVHAHEAGRRTPHSESQGRPRP